jgi:hypothetical protein
MDTNILEEAPAPIFCPEDGGNRFLLNVDIPEDHILIPIAVGTSVLRSKLNLSIEHLSM